MRHGGRIEQEWALAWLRTVAKHEAFAIGRARRRVEPVEEELRDRVHPADAATVEDLCERIDLRERARRELPRLKPQERRALGLLAAGHSYREICAITGWSYTKVNRSITEGRAALRTGERVPSGAPRSRPQGTTNPPPLAGPASCGRSLEGSAVRRSPPVPTAAPP